VCAIVYDDASWSKSAISTGSFVMRAAGIAVVVIGAAAVLFSLFGDRARGKRRCPRCWYDMRATPGLRCSECGYDAPCEKNLHRARLRWWRRTGSLAIVIGIGVYATPWFKSGAWVEYAPNTLLIMRFPAIDEVDDSIAREYWRRFYVKDDPDSELEMWEWQRAMLAHRIVGVLNDPGVVDEIKELGLMLLARMPEQAKGATQEISDAMCSGKYGLRREAFAIARSLAPDAEVYVPAIVDVLRASPGSMECIELLGEIGPPAREAIPAIVSSRMHRWYFDDLCSAIRTIDRIDPLHPEAREFLLGLTFGPGDAERFPAFDVIRKYPELERAFLERAAMAASSSRPDERYRAIRALWRLKFHHDELDAVIERLLDDENENVRLYALCAVQTAHQSPPSVRDRLIAMQDDESWHVRSTAARMLRAIDADGREDGAE